MDHLRLLAKVEKKTGGSPASTDRPGMRNRLRVSGLMAMAVFGAMALSDLLMLTAFDLRPPYRFWDRAATLPQWYVTAGYYLGVLVSPLHAVTTGWHLSLTVRPAGAWASRIVLGATGYSAALLTVFHGAFAFMRSIVVAEGDLATPGGPGTQAALVYGAHVVPLFWIAVGIAGSAYALVFCLMLAGRSNHPRWAGAIVPAVYVLVAFAWPYVAPASLAVILGAAGWNVAGVAAFGVCTAAIWNLEARDAGEATCGASVTKGDADADD